MHCWNRQATFNFLKEKGVWLPSELCNYILQEQTDEWVATPGYSDDTTRANHAIVRAVFEDAKLEDGFSHEQPAWSDIPAIQGSTTAFKSLVLDHVLIPLLQRGTEQEKQRTLELSELVIAKLEEELANETRANLHKPFHIIRNLFLCVRTMLDPSLKKSSREAMMEVKKGECQEYVVFQTEISGDHSPYKQLWTEFYSTSLPTVSWPQK